MYELRSHRVRGLAAVVISLALALAPLAGCGPAAREKAAEQKALKELADAKSSLEFASARDKFEKALTDLFALCERYPGTPVADDAFAAAEDAMRQRAESGDTEFLFDGKVPEPPGGYAGSAGYETLEMRAWVGFVAIAPSAYKDRAGASARSVIATIGEEWAERVEEIANDRIAWAKKMRKNRSAGNYDRILDDESDELAYQRKLLDALAGSEKMREAFRLLAQAVDYSQKTEPDASRTTVSNGVITSYYTPSTLTAAENTGKTLLSRAKAARAALRSATAAD